MKAVNFSDFCNNLAESLNAVNNDGEIVVVSRTKGKNVVVMDLEEYNAIRETMHLTCTAANRKRLHAAITEMESGKFSRQKLLND